MKKEIIEKTKTLLRTREIHYVFFAAVLLAFLVIGVRNSIDNASKLVNIVIVLVMSLFVYFGLGGMKKQNGLLSLLGCQKDFEYLTATIEGLRKEYPGSVLKEFQNTELNIETKELTSVIKAYFEDSESLYIEDQMYHNCDISDYVNEEFLHDVGNTSFSDFVSSAMTGLGILGTFIGLAIGLKSFNAETAEAMTNSITPLIEGIKVAFYTSIFGVILSLVYGSIARRRYNQAYKAMTEFVNVFYRYAGQHAENSAISQLLHYQDSQNESLKQLAEDIGVVFSNAIDESIVPAFGQLAEKMDSMVTAIGASFGDTINTSLVPALNVLAEKMDGMVGSLGEELSKLGQKMDNMAEAIAKQQTEALGDVVDKFLSTMNEILHGQLDNLAKTIETICEWANSSGEKMTAMVDNMVDHNETLTGIVKNNLAVVDALHGYVGQMNDVQQKSMEFVQQAFETVGDSSEKVEKLSAGLLMLTEQSNKIMEKSKELIDAIGEQTTNIINSLGEQEKQFAEQGNRIIDEIAVREQKIVDTIAEQENRIVETIAEQEKRFVTAVTEQSGKITDTMAEQQNRVVSTIAEQEKQFVTTVTEQSTHIVDTIAKQQSRVVEAIVEQEKQFVATVTEQGAKIADTIAEQEKQFADTIVEQEKKISGLADEQITLLKAGSDYVKKQVDHLGAASATVAAGFDASATKMLHASEKLTVEMDNAMVRSFAQFDSQLAKALEHFGGTLQELQDIVENTPKAVSGAADKMSSATREMVAATTKQQNELADTMRKSVQQTQAEANRVISGLNEGQNKLIKAVDEVTGKMTGAAHSVQSMFEVAKHSQENMNSAVQGIISVVDEEAKAIAESNQKQHEMTIAMADMATVLLQQAKQIQSLIDENERLLQELRAKQKEDTSEVNRGNGFRGVRGR